MNEEEFDCEFTDEAVCPYCGHKHSDSWEISDGVFDCEECDETMDVEVDTEITYSTSKVEVKQCKSNLTT